MSQKGNTKLIAIVLLSLLFVFGVTAIFSDILLAPEHQPLAQLVPCGTTANPQPCDFCHLFDLTTNIFNLFIKGPTAILLLIAIVMIVIGAMMMVTSGGNEDRYKGGRKIIQNSVIGFVIAYASLVVIGSILGFIVKASELGNFNFTPTQGIQIQCTTVPASGPQLPIVPTPPPSECSDGIDNDSDGATDFPDDSDCSSPSDPTESAIAGFDACAQCSAYQSVLASGPPAWTSKVAPNCVGDYVRTGPLNSSTRTCPFIHSSINSKVINLRARNSGWVISEAFPPTVDHQSSCHFNGTCFDIVLNPSPSSPISVADAQRLEAICSVAKSAGFSIVNEYDSVLTAPNSSLLIATMPSCGRPQSTGLSTGDHLHLR